MKISIKEREDRLIRKAAQYLKERAVSNTTRIAVNAFYHEPYANDYIYDSYDCAFDLKTEMR